MQKYFAAANTGKGFVSWFDDIFYREAVDYTYIIKGGSGTGKSTLMKRAAEAASNMGADVQFFHCSSDPSSLDGIIMTFSGGRRIAMLDGTSPHTYDPKFPGVRDEIINLGNYWDGTILESLGKKVVELSAKKSALFCEAYANFSSAATLLRTIIGEAKKYTDTEKLDAASMRLLAKRMRNLKYKPTASPKICIRALSALSCDGEVYFDSFSNSEQVYLVTDAAFGAPLAFDSIIRAAGELGLSFDRAPMPLLPEFTEAVRFPELSLSVVSRRPGTDFTLINMSRFLDRALIPRDDKRAIREAIKGSSTLVSLALNKLAMVKSTHGELEKIYGQAMDFKTLEKESKKIVSAVIAHGA